MHESSPQAKRDNPGWYREADCSVAEFAKLLEPDGESAALRFADSVDRHIPLYDCAGLRDTLRVAGERSSLLAEWADVMLRGAGVLVLRRAYADVAPVDEATAIFESIIAREREAGISGADHFAKAGANDRIWNALEKLCLHSPRGI